ncbi:MAG TPA: M23 family metallopeptidase [Pseudomonadales bacterium]|nr:M23 family metallopeptidase [Pseudomonadales bacterium]
MKVCLSRRWRPAVAALLALTVGAAHAELRLVRVLPEQVQAIADPRGWHLNFDVIVENTRAAPVTIDYLELEAFDAEGRLVTRRHLGAGGEPSAIAMVPERVVPGLGRLHLFNPFEVLPADLAFTSLRLGLYHAGGRLQVPITPRMEPPMVLPVLPMGGDLFVESGSDLAAPHRRASLVSDRQAVPGRRGNAQRYALDLTLIDDGGSYRGGARETPENWFAWGHEVRAPVAGRVVAVRDGIADNQLLAGGGVEFAAIAGEDPLGGQFGNHVVVELAPDVHLLLAHLRQGSVAVAVGDRLWAGALVGRVGLSGRATYPHLHVQLQRGDDPLDAEPLPLVFACVEDLGGGRRRPAWLATGDRIGPCVIGR